MSGIDNLSTLLQAMAPELDTTAFVFVSVALDQVPDLLALQPVATCLEEEGMTLVIPEAAARSRGLSYEQTFARISLKVHSSLTAVGLTAAFSAALAQHSISSNVIAGYYHDHIFVPSQDAQRATDALLALSRQ